MENDKKKFSPEIHPGKEQALSLLRDHDQQVMFYAKHHPDGFVRMLGNFALCEMQLDHDNLCREEENGN